MSRFNCTCGSLLTNTSAPASHEARLITDVAADAADGFDDAEFRDVIECPHCGRLHVEAQPHTGLYLAFVPESDRLDIAKEGGGYRG